MSQTNQTYLSFDNPEARATLLEWWGGLEANRGDRAALRHCHSIADVMFTPAYHRLRQRLAPHGFVHYDRLAVVAGVLSHVKASDAHTGSIAQQMATSTTPGGNPRVSGLRFRRLLSLREPEDIYVAGIRLVRLLDGTVNIPSLAAGLYSWNEYTRKRWAFDYYDKAPNAT